jgi:transposase-like protein
MSKKRFDASDKILIAGAWQASGSTQERFAAEHGIRPRTLKSWIRQYSGTAPPVDEARRIVGEAMSRLQNILDSLANS